MQPPRPFRELADILAYMYACIVKHDDLDALSTARPQLVEERLQGKAVAAGSALPEERGGFRPVCAIDRDRFPAVRRPEGKKVPRADASRE